MIFNKKSISLALDSGSAKGVAHIGVIEVFEKNGYKIKAIAGTSMGAVVAAYYSLGKLDLLKNWLLSLDKRSTFFTIDISLNGGFVGGKKLMNAFEKHLGYATFKDTNIPLYIVATDLDSGREEVFTKGSITSALRASISIPGIMKPYLYNNHYYVDGAVTNPLPVDVLYNAGHKNIIAVHLHEHIKNRNENKNPNMLETMVRSITIVSRSLAKAKCKEAAFFIEPEVAEFDMFHFYQSQKIIEAGSIAALKAIENGHLDSMYLHFLHKLKNCINNYILKRISKDT